MELGLSLGEPQAKSPEKMIGVGRSPSTKLKLGFCAGPGFGREIRGQELEEEEMEGETEKKGRTVHSPVQLDLLLPHHFPLPSQTRNSEPPLEEEASDEEENGSLSKKKLRLSKEQSAFLEQSFKEHNTLNPRQKHDLAKQLNLRPRQVEVWFQNRRARTKLKQTEVNCDYLKRCCETLREENRRLQKELSELRALKRSDCSCTQLPATTLAMCPSCERISSTNRRCCFSLH